MTLPLPLPENPWGREEGFLLSFSPTVGGDGEKEAFYTSILLFGLFFTLFPNSLFPIHLLDAAAEAARRNWPDIERRKNGG